MLHHQKHYAKKHAGKEISLEEKLKEHLLAQAKEGTLACPQLLLMARERGKSPQEIGVYLDLLEIRIGECQLGLFGASGKETAKPDVIDPAIQRLIEKDVKDGCVSCESLLEIAEQNRTAPMTVSGICDALEIKIKPCQLGAF